MDRARAPRPGHPAPAGAPRRIRPGSAAAPCPPGRRRPRPSRRGSPWPRPLGALRGEGRGRRAQRPGMVSRRSRERFRRRRCGRVHTPAGDASRWPVARPRCRPRPERSAVGIARTPPLAAVPAAGEGRVPPGHRLPRRRALAAAPPRARCAARTRSPVRGTGPGPKGAGSSPPPLSLPGPQRGTPPPTRARIGRAAAAAARTRPRPPAPSRRHAPRGCRGSRSCHDPASSAR